MVLIADVMMPYYAHILYIDIIVILSRQIYVNVNISEIYQLKLVINVFFPGTKFWLRTGPFKGFVNF